MALAQGGSPPSGGYDYTVQPGDSWLALAGRTNIPVADLKAANPTALHPYDWLWQGERLFIPARPLLPPGQPAATAASSTAAGDWYQVKTGDTWQTVARASGVAVLDLWHANPLQLRPNAGSTPASGFGFRRPQLPSAPAATGSHRNRRASRDRDAHHAYRQASPYGDADWSAYRNPGSPLSR